MDNQYVVSNEDNMLSLLKNSIFYMLSYMTTSFTNVLYFCFYQVHEKITVCDSYETIKT